jgi:metallo-beta-lactamase family protein
MQIQFLGATRQVTGSCYLLKAADLTLMVDCGMYQERPFLDRNWEGPPVALNDIDYVLLTHAHLDHSGRIPRLVHDGYAAPVLATHASAELAKIIFMDSARIQEEDARYKKKRHDREQRQGPHPELPLYTIDDAEKAIPLLQKTDYNTQVALSDDVTVCFHDAGHILGSSIIELNVKENGSRRTILFSGDIGQWDRPIINDPSLFERADYIVMESTYGDRDHKDEGDVLTLLEEIVNDTVRRGGNLVIPVFAIERAQEMMYYFSELVRQDRIPQLLIFLDSPMAVKVTDVFRHHVEDMDEEAREMLRSNRSPFRFPGLRLVQSVSESKAINYIKGSCIIMAGSGMCTGGRVKHHLVHNIADPASTVLFVGYQARNTLGRQILECTEKSDTVRIHGEHHPVWAKIEQLHGLSAHADHSELLRWITHLQSPPRQVFITHGEEETALSFARELNEQTGWSTLVPEYQQVVELD